MALDRRCLRGFMAFVLVTFFGSIFLYPTLMNMYISKARENYTLGHNFQETEEDKAVIY